MRRTPDTPGRFHMHRQSAPSVGPMTKRRSTRPRRRPGEPTAPLYVDVAPDVDEKIAELSTTLGVPKWAVIEAAIRAAEPGTNGVPDGWVLPARGEELPISFAA